MFKATVIFYITKNNIFLVSKKTALQRLDIKPFVVGQEVLDIGSFIKSLSSFILRLKIKNTKTLIVIDESLTYEKEIHENEINQNILEQFSQELPFDAKKLEIANIKIENENVLIATNKYIYQCLIKALLQNSNEIQFVIPAKYVSLHETDLQTLSFDDLLNKITTRNKIEEINFKQGEIDLPQSVQAATKIPTTNIQESAQVDKEQSQPDPTISKPSNHQVLFKYLLIALFALATTAIFVYIAVKGLTR